MLLSLYLALQALDFSDTDDQELVELYLTTRSERFFSELYRRYSSKVYAKSLSMLMDESQANDAVQDVFEKVLRRIGGFRKDSKFSTWLFSITNNHCIDVLRKKQRQRGKTEAIPEKDIPEVIEDADWLEEQSPKAIKYILQELSELDRAALVFKYMEEMSVKEIASAMGLQESATKMRLKRARTRAKKIYLQWCEINTETYA